jgi:hypothetical protein
VEPGPTRNLYLAYVGVAVAAPLVMLVYLRLDLVCAPRAIVSEAICGALALGFLTPAVLRGSRPLLTAALAAPAIMVPLTPIVMFSVLGWDGVVHGHLIAFFTFEAIAAVEIVLIVLMLRWKSRCCVARGDGQVAGSQAGNLHRHERNVEVCCCDERKQDCKKPENLKGKPEDCTPEQIRTCHGNSGKHPDTSAGVREEQPA